MKKLDRFGARLCSYQAEIFKTSLSQECSSLVFLRRFFFSENHLFSYDTDDCFDSLAEQYEQTDYGKNKLPENVLYWLGYITRYFCYTRDISSKKLYRLLSLKPFISNYEVYHTQNEEWVLSRILETTGLSEDAFDKEKQTRKILRSIWSAYL